MVYNAFRKTTMNENIDLTKILEGCPEGTKFYSPIIGDVFFDYIEGALDYPLICCYAITNSGVKMTIYFTKDGKYFLNEEFKGAEIVLFYSRDQRDWSKFERFWDKPKVERFDPKTLQPFDKVLVRDKDTELWSINFYSFYNAEYCRGEFPNFTSAGCYRYAIPYNDETKHLVGTFDEAPEYYRYWEE